MDVNLKKTSVAVAVVLLVVATLYSTVWLYQAGRAKELADQVLQQISTELAGEQSDFFYSQTQVSGFPFSFEVYVHQPRFIDAGGGALLEVESSEPVVVAVNMWGDYAELRLPTSFRFRSEYTGQDRPLQITFDEPVRLAFTLSEGELLKALWFDDKELTEVEEVERFADVHRFTYSGNGFEISEVNTGVVVADVEKLFAKYSADFISDEQKSIEFLFELKNAFYDNFLEVEGFDQKLGMTNIEIDVSFLGPKRTDWMTSVDTRINVSKFYVDTEPFGFGIKGVVQTAVGDIFPFGTLEFVVKDYGSLVEYYADLANYKMKDSFFSWFRLRNWQKRATKTFLAKLASETRSEGKDIRVAIKREQGEDLFVGDLSLPEVMRLFKTSFTYSRPKPRVVKEQVDEAEEES